MEQANARRLLVQELVKDVVPGPWLKLLKDLAGSFQPEKEEVLPPGWTSAVSTTARPGSTYSHQLYNCVVKT